MPEISFADLHTVCICGDNGNGKSALIDAMTWALWGKARAKSDLDLIAQGQNEMSVEFDFAVGEQIYRIIRKYAKPRSRAGSATPVLEFQVFSNGIFRSISEPNIRLTEKKIIDTLHMDYDTFINSAFLKQGQADEFTKQPPAKRKEVLANILGLKIYDELEERAKNKFNTWKLEADNLEHSLHSLEEKLSMKPDLERQLKMASEQLITTEMKLQNEESEINRLREQREILNIKVNQIKQLENYIRNTNNTLGQWQNRISHHTNLISQYRQLIAQSDLINDSFSRYASLKQQNDELNQKAIELGKLMGLKNQLELSIEKSKNSLLREYAVVESRIKELERKVQILPMLEEEQKKLEELEIQLKNLEIVHEEKQKQKQELRDKINQFEFNITTMQNQLKEIDDKLVLLTTEKGARCPLCEQELGEEHRQEIERKYLSEKKNKQESIEENRYHREESWKLLHQIELEIKKLEEQMKQKRAYMDMSRGTIETRLNESKEALESLKNEQKRFEELKNRIINLQFAINEQQKLKETEDKIHALDYDEHLHDQIRRTLQDFSKYEELKKRLDIAREQYEKENELLKEAQQNLVECQTSLEKYQNEKNQLSNEIKGLEQIEKDLQNARLKYNQTMMERDQAKETVARYKVQLERLTEEAEEKKKTEERLANAKTQMSIFQELVQAFSKKGIQGLLIETAIPEIEQEANYLLGKMTDNRMHIKLEAQRATRTGEMMETLDINISDELGTRSYEMFSGGEAFRINFAIRIALSRLLARRAGAPLPTLIIDEGFGTQDSTGIERIKEAIISIQQDFEKIMVITHIEDLKDAFPARIDVVKTEKGSTIILN